MFNALQRFAQATYLARLPHKCALALALWTWADEMLFHGGFVL